MSHKHASVIRTYWLERERELTRQVWGRTIQIIRKLVGRWELGLAIDRAAEVSFYFALSCFPFLMVLTVLLGWLHRSGSSFWYWLTHYMPSIARETVLTEMAGLSKGSGHYLSFGLVLTIWSASTGFLSLMDALTGLYGEKDSRSYLQRRGIAVLATLVAAIFLVVCFWIWQAGHLLGGLLERDVAFSTQWTVVRWLVTLAMIILAVDLMNYFLPGTRPRWRWVTPGSVFTALSFVIASALLSVYVSHSPNMSHIYGTLTGFIVVMLWIYLVTLSILLGAQTDAALVVPQEENPGAKGALEPSGRNGVR
jgi:membrane protein